VTQLRSLTLDIYGTRNVLAAADEDCLELMRSAVPANARPAVARHGDPRFKLTRDDDGRYLLERASEQAGLTWVPLTAGDAHDVVETLEHEVRMHAAFTAPAHVFIHAGAVALGSSAIIVPGESFSGKTTLVAALLRVGATYYSDEYAVIDTGGMLHPFPKPLAMRTLGGGPEQKPQAAADLGAETGTAGVPLALVVLTQFRPGAHWQPSCLTPAEAILKLFEHSYQGRDRPEMTLRTLRRALAGAVALTGERGEADETAQLLVTELAQSA
jgi:hypothetical protein